MLLPRHNPVRRGLDHRIDEDLGSSMRHWKGHSGRALTLVLSMLIGLTLLAPDSSSLRTSRVVAAAEPAHVMMLVEENRSYGSVIGNSQLPYLNSLEQQYGLAT